MEQNRLKKQKNTLKKAEKKKLMKQTKKNLVNRDLPVGALIRLKMSWLNILKG